MAREWLRKAISDLTLEKLILREAASGNVEAPLAAEPASSTSERSSGSRSGSPVAFSASIGRPEPEGAARAER